MSSTPDPDEAAEAHTDEKGAHLETVLSSDDVDNPQNWPRSRRWLIVVACSSMGMISVLAPSIIIPSAPQVLQTFHVHDDLYRTLLVTIWELGEGASPFFAGPFSEVVGRAPIFHIGNLLGVVLAVASALSTNISMLIAFRFLNGFFLTAPTLVPSIIGDVIRPSERGVAMAFGQSLQTIAPFVAPIAGAYINEGLGWRWVNWILAILVGAIAVFSLLVVRETYAPIIKRKSKAAHMRAESADATSSDPKAMSKMTAKKIALKLLKPMHLLFTSPVVFLLSIYSGVVGGIQYIVTTTLTEILEQDYGFPRGNVGLAFIAPSLGFLIGVFLYGFTSDRYLKHQETKHGGRDPKYRLVHAILGSCILPAGLLFYGWTLRYHLPWIVPLIGTALIGMSYILTVLPTQNYLVDTYETHSASAISAFRIVLAIFAAVFPLIGPPLYKSLGYGWGNSLLALITAIFIPLLILLIRFGEPVRTDDIESDNS